MTASVAAISASSAGSMVTGETSPLAGSMVVPVYGAPIGLSTLW